MVLARQRGLIVKDLGFGGGGDCMFLSVLHGLEILGIQPSVSVRTLRHQLSTFLENNPYSPDNTHLKESLCAPVLDSCDTAEPTVEDYVIESVSDPDVRADLRWQKYLRDLQEGAWGENIAFQGLADMLSVNINVISALRPVPVTPTHQSPIEDIHIGLYGQDHYVALDRMPRHSCTSNATAEPHSSVATAITNQDCQLDAPSTTVATTRILIQKSARRKMKTLLMNKLN